MSKTQLNAILALGLSAPIDLAAIDVDKPMAFWFDKATTSGTFTFYGTLDVAAASTNNAVHLGSYVVTPGETIPPNIAKALKGWRYVMIDSPGAATFYIEGDTGGAPAVASVAAPVGVAYSTLMDLTAFDTEAVRLMGSSAMTTADAFKVYVTQDGTTNPAVTGTNGALYAGNIYGGGQSSPNASMIVQGWPYAFFQRDASFSGTTVGSIKGAGVAASSASIPAVITPATPFTLVERNAAGEGVLDGVRASPGAALAINASLGISITAANGTANTTSNSAAGAAGVDRTAQTTGGVGAATLADQAISFGGNANATTTVAAVAGAASANRSASGRSATATTSATSTAGAADLARTALAAGGAASVSDSATSDTGAATAQRGAITTAGAAGADASDTVTSFGGTALANATVSGVTAAGAQRTVTATGGPASVADSATGSTSANVNRTATSSGGNSTAQMHAVGTAGSVADISASVIAGANASVTATTAGGLGEVHVSTASTVRIRVADTGVVGIGAALPAVGCALDIESTTLAFKPPVLDAAGVAALAVTLAGQPAGPSCFNSTTGVWNYWNGAAMAPAALAGQWALGGQATGATMVGGSTDGQQVHLITNNLVRLNIGAAGAIGVGAAAASAWSAFELAAANTTLGSTPWPRFTTVQEGVLAGNLGAGDVGACVHNTDQKITRTWAWDAGIAGGAFTNGQIKANGYALASLTNQAAQYLGDGTTAATSLTGLGGRIQRASSVWRLDYSYIGDVLNIGGQTATISAEISTDGGATWGAIAGATTAGLATTAGRFQGTVFFAPVAVGARDMIRLLVTIGVGALTAVLTQVAISIE